MTRDEIIKTCPRCDQPIKENELVHVEWLDPVEGDEKIEKVEHRTRQGCGRWLWRRKQEKPTVICN